MARTPRRRQRATRLGITITTLEQLNKIWEAINDSDDLAFPLTQDELKEPEAAAIFNPKSPAAKLHKWFAAHDLTICNTGFKKILAAKGKYWSWKTYFEEHWDDGDGVRGWFSDSSEVIVGRYIGSSYEACDLDGNFKVEGAKWGPWPFRRCKASLKAKPKRRKAKHRR